MSQLAFDLPCRESHSGEDFFVSPSNRAAVDMIDRWPEWPAHAVALIGPAASGKTHLAAVWRTRAGAEPFCPNTGIAEQSATRGRPAVFIEDVDMALESGRLDPIDLFHRYNWLREHRGFLLLTGRVAPARWPVALPDLRSRLASTPIISIGPPDDDLLAAVLVKRLSDRQLRVAPKVVDFIVARTERSFEAIDRLVAALDAESLAHRRPITIPLARAVFERISLP